MIEKNSTVWQLWQRISRYRMKLVAIILLALLGNGLLLLTPWLTGLAIDTMIGEGEVIWSELRLVIIFLVISVALGSLCQKILFNTTVNVSAGVAADLRREISLHADKLPLSEIDSRDSGNIASMLTHDLNALSDGLVTGLSQAFGGLVTLIGTLFMMLRLHAGVTLIIIVLTPVSFFVSSRITNAARKQYQRESKKIAGLRQLAEEAAEQMSLLQSMAAREIYARRLQELNRDLYDAGRRAQFYSSLSNPVSRLINSSAYILVAAAASIMAVAGRLSTGNVATLLGYSMQFSRPINEITSVAAQLQSAMAGAERIFSLLASETEADDQVGSKKFAAQDGRIDMSAVEFSYYPGQNLINDLDLHVPAGSQVAVVGPTGAGKTTLINLLLRFYDIQAGDISIDEQSIFSMTRHDLRASFGMVLQDSWLFGGTIRENIAFAKVNASDEDIIAASIDAGAHSFIRRLPEGYDTVIRAGSDQLSAGQKQLISIARTMLADAPILILDEATSNVDTYTEKKIQRAFARMMTGRTSFVIAHRLSTILDSDLILVMDRGRIIEQGTHDDLMAAGGFYADLFMAQYAGREL